MTVPIGAIHAARLRSLRAAAVTVGDARLDLRVALRRARGGEAPPLPLEIDFRLGGNAPAFTIGKGWAPPEDHGSWTVGPTAQILIVPSAAVTGRLVVGVEMGAVLLAPQRPRQIVTVDVNGETSASWEFAIGGADASHRSLPVPPGATTKLGAILITFGIDNPLSPHLIGAGTDTRDLGFVLRRLTVDRADAASPS